ncbi:MAG TPA: hypothetical protein DIT76_05420, partial [Spartobacteria bacterium]|nr:hypothetical protein [Spartobacteria bacterium]
MRAIPIIINQTIAGAFVALIWLVIPFAAMGQDAAPSPPSSDYVSRAEYDKLKAEHEAMKTELDALKTAVRQMAGTAPAAPAEGPAAATKPSEGKQVVTTTAAQTDVAALQAEVDTLKTQVKET